MYRHVIIAGLALLMSAPAEAKSNTIGGGSASGGSIIVATPSVKGLARGRFDSRIPPAFDTRIPPRLTGQIPQPFAASSTAVGSVRIVPAPILGNTPLRSSKIAILTTEPVPVTIVRTRVHKRGFGKHRALVCAPAISGGIRTRFIASIDRPDRKLILIVQGSDRVLVGGLVDRPSVAQSRIAIACAKGLGTSSLVVVDR